MPNEMWKILGRRAVFGKIVHTKMKIFTEDEDVYRKLGFDIQV